MSQTVEATHRTPAASDPPAPLSEWTKAVYFLAGNVLPAMGILLVSSSMGLPTWQSNEFHEFVAFLIVGPAAAVFCLFLLYSIGCFTLALFRPQVAVENFLIRLGLYTGMILGLHYCLLFGIQFLNIKHASSAEGIIKIIALTVSCVLIALVGWGLWTLGGAIRPLLEQVFKSWAWVVLAMLIPLAALAVGFALPDDQSTPIFALLLIGPALIAVGLTPCWYLAANFSLAIHIVRLRGRRFQFQIWQLLAWTSWLAAYLAVRGECSTGGVRGAASRETQRLLYRDGGCTRTSPHRRFPRSTRHIRNNLQDQPATGVFEVRRDRPASDLPVPSPSAASRVRPHRTNPGTALTKSVACGCGVFGTQASGVDDQARVARHHAKIAGYRAEALRWLMREIAPKRMG